MRDRLDNDQSNQDLPEVRRKNLFRRAGSALCQVRVEKRAWQFTRRAYSRSR